MNSQINEINSTIADGGNSVDDGPGFLFNNPKTWIEWITNIHKNTGYVIANQYVDKFGDYYKELIHVNEPSHFPKGQSGVDSKAWTMDSIKTTPYYKDWIKAISAALKVSQDAIKKLVKESIKKQNGKWVVTDSSGKKILGTHDTKENALDQLAAIEISKQKNEQVQEKIINEITKSEFLDNAIRKKDIGYRIKLKEFNRKQKRLKFAVGDYDVMVELVNFPTISRLKGNLEEKVNMAFNDDVKVYCSCNDFRYGGAKYNTFQLDAGIYVERRKPNVNDPDSQHFSCKHINHLFTKVNEIKLKNI